MTDNEIIKALECCLKGDYDKIINALCGKCPYCKNTDCKLVLQQDALDLINRQKAEIERLQKAIKVQDIMIEQQDYKIKTAKSEGIKEFAEKLKAVFPSIAGAIDYYVRTQDVDLSQMFMNAKIEPIPNIDVRAEHKPKRNMYENCRLLTNDELKQIFKKTNLTGKEDKE